MTKRHTPPGRWSKALVVVEKPFGPHHCARCFGSVQTSHTSSRDASSTRVPTSAQGSWSRSRLFLSATLALPGLQLAQIVVEAVEALFPEPAVFLEPLVNIPQR